MAFTSSTRTEAFIVYAERVGKNLDQIQATYSDGRTLLVVKSGGRKYDRLAVYHDDGNGCTRKGYFFCRVGSGVVPKAVADSSLLAAVVHIAHPEAASSTGPVVVS